MSDTSLNRFLGTGTTAERTAFVPSPPGPASGPDQGYFWYDTDLQTIFAYDFVGGAWVGGSGTVTHSSGALTANAVIIGNGTGDLKALGSLGTTTTVLHGNAAGAPTYGAVALATDVSGDLPFANLTQIAGLSVLGVTGSSTADVAAITAGTDGHVLTRVSSSSLAFAVPSVPTGGQVQVVNTQSGAVATGTTLIPFDDTIPQNTEGDEYMTLAITPTNSSNKLQIEVVAFATSSVGSWIAVALFQDTTANALACQASLNSNVATGGGSIALAHFMAAGTTSSTTFKVRIGGSSAGTVTFNGQSAGRKYGGVLASSITITEIKV